MTIIESLVSSLRTMYVANINLANEAADTIERQQMGIKSLTLALGLANISSDHHKVLLNSCETALYERDEEIESQQREIESLLEANSNLWRVQRYLSGPL